MMNINYRHTVRMLPIAALAVIAGVLPSFASGPHLATLYKYDGGRASGKVRYLASSKAYEIYMNNNVRQQVMASKVKQVVLKTQPTALKPAVDNVKRGKYAAAIAPLKKIMTDYEMFGPDVTAAQYLAQAYLGMGRPADASRVCKDVLASNPNAISDPEFAGIYWDSLLQEKKYATLKRVLDDVAQTGSHEIAAVALVKRGDVLLAQGDAKKALLDGYLRTILMFQDVKDIQPEALYKAMKAHQAIGEHPYAEKWRKRLLAGYPASDYAKKL